MSRLPSGSPSNISVPALYTTISGENSVNNINIVPDL